MPPEPRYPIKPPGPGVGGTRVGKIILLNLVISLAMALLVLFLVPTILGANPLEVLRGKAPGKVETVKTVEERIVKAGQEAVVEVANKVLPSVVHIEVSYRAVGKGIGSGFIYSPDGYIITNHHVIDNASAIVVYLADGTSREARVVGWDSETDVAVLKVDAQGLPPAELGTSSDLVVGELAVAVGSPEGLEQSVTSGIISALHRNVLRNDGTYLLDVIQTDAAINPGNSGGPLCNSAGQVVGINTAIVSSTGENIGIGFAIAIDNAKPVIEQLIKTGRVTHPWIGIMGSTLEPDVAERFGLPTQKGVVIKRVVAGTPADKAGLEPGDIIVSLDGEAVESMDRLVLLIRRRKVGDKITLEFYRGKERSRAELTLEEKPSRF
jgi:serine protease Do